MASDSPHANGPSSPEDTSNPIANINSSPAALRRTGNGRRRGKSSTPTQFATPPPTSRLGASNSTPPTSRPSAARSNGRNGRTPTTPSYTDEVPLSSEEYGEGDDADDTVPTFVWGTNISVQDIKSALRYATYDDNKATHNKSNPYNLYIRFSFSNTDFAFDILQPRR